MSAEKIYPKGIMCFQKHEKAPDFVLGSVVITVNDLVKFCKENPQYLTDYKGEKQLRLQALTGNKGLYFTVDTYKPKETAPQHIPDKDENSPF